MQAIKASSSRRNSVIACSGSVNYTGESGTFEYTIDFGTDTGYAGIVYNSWGIPDRFTIEWNGQVITTGFVGDPSGTGGDYNQQLLNLGYTEAEINTGAGTSKGVLYLDKTAAFPNTAKITVEAPLADTAWEIFGICPQAEEPYVGLEINPELSEISYIGDQLTLGWGIVNGVGEVFATLNVYGEPTQQISVTGLSQVTITYPNGIYLVWLQVWNSIGEYVESNFLTNQKTVEILTPTEGQIFTEGDTITLTSQIT